MLGESSLLSAGFNLGWVNKSINVNGLKFPDQFDGRFFDNNLPTAVQLQNTSVNYFDLQAGINYAYFPTEDIYINAGYSMHHLNKAKESFFATGINDRMPMRHIAFLNAAIKCNDQLILHPNFFYTHQSMSSNLLAGALANINLSEKGEKQLLAGLYYRWKEAAIPMLGVEVNHLQVLFNYDVTISGLKNYNQGRGAAEISITKKGFYGNPAVRQTLCPSF
jgi:type IX secretion system PorP/SprF family membrane protein